MHYNKSPWHFVLPAGLLRFILCLSSLSVLKCSCYVQSSASGLDQLLAGSLPLPSYTDTPLSLDQPPPSVCGWGYTNRGTTHNLGSHTTLSQRWRTRSQINVTSFSTPQEITWAKNMRHSISEQEINWFYIMYWLRTSFPSINWLSKT